MTDTGNKPFTVSGWAGESPEFREVDERGTVTWTKISQWRLLTDDEMDTIRDMPPFDFTDTD